MTDLHYEIRGTGETLVLIHSGGTDLRDWQFIAPELAKNFRVVLYDARGMGQSPVPTQPTNHVADLEELLESLSIEKAMFVGHSSGGEIATNFTLNHPERVEKLVLIAPGLTGYVFSPAYQQMTKDIWAVVPDAGKMLGIMLNTPEAYAVQEAMQSPQRDLMVRIHRENVEKSLTFRNLEQVWSENPPTIERLTEIKTETLFIVGTKDTADVLAIADLFRQLFHIQFVRIDNADHALTWTHPKEIIDAISDFLKR